MPDRRRLRIEKKYSWEHHRGGWSAIVDFLEEQFHHDSGTLFISAVEDRLWYDGAIYEPWVGVVHQVPKHHYDFPDLERLFQLDAWERSHASCLGLWVLSNYAESFVAERVGNIPVSVLPYPQDRDVPPFSWESFTRTRRVLQVGEFLRNHQAFFDLHSPMHDKMMLVNEEIREQFARENVIVNATVRLQDYVDNAEYDDLLASSIVFLNLRDAVAVTVVLECIVRGTPVLTNRVGALEEFLGSDYPLFYSDIDTAARYLTDGSRLTSTRDHLLERAQHLGSFDDLATAVATSTSFVGLRSPRLAQNEFATFDISVVVFSYRRTVDLPALIRALAAQDFPGTMEVLLWNNNAANASEVDRIVAGAPKHLNLRIFHSSQNYYCIPRLALASLCRSPLMMLCDDDVVPSPTYLTRFIEAHDRLSRSNSAVAVCTRGHRFKPHKVPSRVSDEVWHDDNLVEFFDEADPECAVHFMHADSLIVSTDLMRQCASIQIPQPEWALVDDYWISFALSAHLGVSLVKIEGSDLFSFTPSADDEEVALFHNPDVRAERLRFYLFHMRLGWPYSPSKAREGHESTS